MVDWPGAVSLLSACASQEPAVSDPVLLLCAGGEPAVPGSWKGKYRRDDWHGHGSSSRDAVRVLGSHDYCLCRHRVGLQAVRDEPFATVESSRAATHGEKSGQSSVVVGWHC